MIRPERVAMAKQLIIDAKSKVLVGTVIDFPEGKSSLEKKLEEIKLQSLVNQQKIDEKLNYPNNPLKS
jgi:deoxyribose-phosphate aldolase